VNNVENLLCRFAAAVIVAVDRVVLFVALACVEFASESSRLKAKSLALQNHLGSGQPEVLA
jgi:hypothetical protein